MQFFTINNQLVNIFLSLVHFSLAQGHLWKAFYRITRSIRCFFRVFFSRFYGNLFTSHYLLRYL